jgi:O-acetyl-ADP-ribose deacetylase (regulator of RNase III)
MNFPTHSLSALGLDLTTASVEFPPASGDCFCSVTGELLSVGNIPDLVRELLETESRRVEMHNIELSNVQKLALLSNGAPAMVHVARSFGVFATAANELVAGGGVPLSGPAAYSEKTRRKVAKRATKSHTGKAKCLSQVTLKGSKGCVIEVVEGDIVENNGVECIVNPANEDLNNGGGAARVISQASGGAGGEFERACRIFIRTKRRLATGTAFVTHKTGKLKRKGIKTICNAVGPIYQGGNSDEEIVLMKTFYAVLQEAQASGVKSIAIPPISLGIFSIPEKLVFRAMIVATLCWAATDGKRGCLKKIQFISNQKRVGNESTARDIATWLEEALDTRSFDKANARAASVERESDFATAQAQWYFEVYNHELSSDRTTVKMHEKRWQKFEPDQCGKIDDTYLDMKSTDPGSHTGATANMVDFSGEKRVVDVKEGGIVNIVQTGNRYSIVFDEAAGFENAPSMLSNLKKAYGYRSSRAMYQYNKRTHSSREVIRIEKASREATLDCAFADAREASEGATFGGAVRSWARWAIGSTSRGPANLDELLRGVTPATYTKRFGDGSSAASPETATARDAADAMPSCDTMNADSDCDTKLLSGTQLQLAGLPQCLERTSMYLKRWLNDALITKEMLLGTKNAVIRQALEDALEGIQHDHGVSIEMTDDKLIISGYRFAHSASDAIVDGPQEALSQLKEVRMEAIEDAWVDTSASLVEAKRLKYPLEWECRTLDHPQQPEVQESRFIKINTTDKKSTVRGMCEYTRIKKKLRADVPAATNIKIHIFQDKQKWCTSCSYLSPTHYHTYYC